MASYELSAFDRRFQAISLVAAIEQQGPCNLNVGFWIRDPNQYILWPDMVTAHPRQDFCGNRPALKFLLGFRAKIFIVRLIFPLLKPGRLINSKNTVILKRCHRKLRMILS